MTAGRYVKAVLWDMDGTLMDSQPLWDEAFRRCCRERGGTVTEEHVAGIAGASIERTCGLIAATGAAPSPEDPAAAEIFSRMTAEVEAAVRADPPILPGARRITSMLSEVGLAQVIVTQSPRRIVESVARALGDVFVALVTGDDGLSGKPAPAPYAAAVELLGLRPEQCVVVEDSATGAASARSNDLLVVQVGGGAKHFPGDPGLIVVRDLASITPHLLLWDDSVLPSVRLSAAGSGRASADASASDSGPAGAVGAAGAADAVGAASAVGATGAADATGAAGAAGAADVVSGERTYAADELFFSTTDASGRIRRANSIFMRLSGYPRGALVGRAHNVVRHPDMPAGLFRSIWEDISAGGAASAYITNRSSDGGRYRVFATIVPSGDGFLSVRTLPMRTGLRDTIEAVYARVRMVEAASAAGGSSRREAAAAGQAALVEELRALGYRDSTDFTRRTLPDEVAALVAAGVAIPERDVGGPLARVLAEMNGVEVATADLVALLDECGRLVALLGRRSADIDALSARLGRLRDCLREVAADVGSLGSGRENNVSERYREVDALILECVEQLHPLAGQVAELRGDVDSVRFGIALLRLHNLASGFFALQIIDGEDELEANDAVGSLDELAGALRDGAERLTERLSLYHARAELVGGELDDVAGALTAIRRPLLDLLDAASEAGTVAGASVRAARPLVRDGFPEARDLADLAGAVRDLDVPYAAADVEARLVLVEAALAELV